MSYLLDTNVLSELRRRVPDPAVVAWVEGRPASTFFVSVLTLGEIRNGIESLADERRRLRLLDWLEAEVPAFFAGRIWPSVCRSPTDGAACLPRPGTPYPPSTACWRPLPCDMACAW